MAGIQCAVSQMTMLVILAVSGGDRRIRYIRLSAILGMEGQLGSHDTFVSNKTKEKKFKK